MNDCSQMGPLWARIGLGKPCVHVVLERCVDLLFCKPCGWAAARPTGTACTVLLARTFDPYF